LRNYTDPSLDAVRDAFVLSEAHAEQPVAEPLELPDGYCEPVSYINDDFMDSLFSGVFLDFPMDHDAEMPDTVPTMAVSIPFPQMHHRTEELVRLLECQHKALHTLPLSNERAPIDLFRAVLSSDNVAKYVSAFFRYFHPHTPFIHQASFDVETVSSQLLLAVSLVGSGFLAPQDHALSARGFFGLAEEYVFGLLRQMGTQRSMSAGDILSTVQAALLIHALQMDSNNAAVRLRMRVNRFPAILASMRSLGWLGATRARLEDCEQFIFDEQKIRYGLRIVDPADYTRLT
jgi:hypothetical protein